MSYTQAAGPRFALLHKWLQKCNIIQARTLCQQFALVMATVSRNLDPTTKNYFGNKKHSVLSDSYVHILRLKIANN